MVVIGRFIPAQLGLRVAIVYVVKEKLLSSILQYNYFGLFTSTKPKYSKLFPKYLKYLDFAGIVATATPHKLHIAAPGNAFFAVLSGLKPRNWPRRYE